MPRAAGSTDRRRHDPVVHQPDLRRGGRGQLVEPVVTAEDPRVDAAAGQHAGHDRRHPRVGTADRLGGGLDRVGERAEHVEGRGDAELAPRHRRVPQGRVEGGREAEGDADLLGEPGDAVGRQVEPDPQRLEDVGRAGLARGRAVAVLDHAGAGAGGHDRGHRRDVDAHRAVAAGADHVERAAGDRQRRRDGVHRVEQAGDLVDRLALGTQRDGETGDLGRRGGAGEHLPHRPRGLVGGEVVALDERTEDLGPGVVHDVSGWRAHAAAAER